MTFEADLPQKGARLQVSTTLGSEDRVLPKEGSLTKAFFFLDEGPCKIVVAGCAWFASAAERELYHPTSRHLPLYIEQGEAVRHVQRTSRSGSESDMQPSEEDGPMDSCPGHAGGVLTAEFSLPDVDGEVITDVKKKLQQHPLRGSSCRPPVSQTVTSAVDNIVIDELEEQMEASSAVAAAAVVPELELPNAETAGKGPCQGWLRQFRRGRRGRSSRWVLAQGVVTLQMYGLSPWLGVDKLLETLNEACGMCNCYNYVHIPRNLRGAGRGYAFINMRSVQWAAQVVELLEGMRLPVMQPGGEDWGPVSFAAAKRQGYSACTQKAWKQYGRVRNPALNPYVTTEDGFAVLMAPPEVQCMRWQTAAAAQPKMEALADSK
mmetsp:Transcript_35719/g.83630  ORF Transcript_35719/g.83630 Transcript_35719/m.83630 type:complete len:377 (-) Transcript_35719:146-1276(-)|eukprot:CAMPEP_0178410164 /NCGR_PEP_ID=MMETSP0689_2-20121128/20838_1 /TAXON_ID=160604 /ORGANISM="Amphidinium massartii, Strain CS-259" /LENGTH=376 /DNA_ID=CAMNT_0020031331 /DNA_START=96 /DNA_END=1226 /DNA_ORIENTATION=-